MGGLRVNLVLLLSPSLRVAVALSGWWDGGTFRRATGSHPLNSAGGPGFVENGLFIPCLGLPRLGSFFHL